MFVNLESDLNQLNKNQEFFLKQNYFMIYLFFLSYIDINKST